MCSLHELTPRLVKVRGHDEQQNSLERFWAVRGKEGKQALPNCQNKNPQNFPTGAVSWVIHGYYRANFPFGVSEPIRCGHAL